MDRHMANKALRRDDEGTIRHDAGLEHAPDDVLDIVYTKMGMGDVAACRGVCRRFREFIDSPRFVALYNKQSPPIYIYIARQDERCKAVGDPEEGLHRFLDLEGSGCMKLMATTYALMCFLHGNRHLLVVNPLTGQAQNLPVWKTDKYSSVVAAGIHFDQSTSEYTVVAAMTDESYCPDSTLCMAIYHSATGTWSEFESRKTSLSIKKTSPITWFEGTVGEPYKKQLVLKLDESSNRWIDLKVSPPHQKMYLELRLVGGRLLLGHEWDVETGENPRLVRSNVLQPGPDVIRYAVCYSELYTGRMVFQMIGDNHQCCVPEEKDLFTADYLSPPRYCTVDSSRFEFSFGLGI